MTITGRAAVTPYGQLRGAGPVLVLMGAAPAAPSVATLAGALATDYTLVTQNPPGGPQAKADAAAALLDTLGARSVDVFGSGGDALAALALAERHPGRVRTLVVHEPELPQVLPAAAAEQDRINDIVATLHRSGPAAAWELYLASPGFGHGEQWPGHPCAGPGRGYLPDVRALAAGPTRIVVGVGAAGSDRPAYRASCALAELLGAGPVEFPGDDRGFLDRPTEFAAALREVLSARPA